MAAIDLTGYEALTIAKRYTKETVEGAGAIKGKDGKSAYQIAVDKGFVGTEEEWLASLQGEDGEPGPQGEPGEQGPPGPKGDPGAGGVDFTYDAENENVIVTKYDN